MRAIILAAGRGTRMQNHTKNKPKCLIKIKGKQLLDWQLKAIKSAGINKIALITGYKKNLLQKFRLKTFHNAKWAKTNMVYSLSKGETWLNQGPCIISYSDIYYTKEAVKSLVKTKARIALTYDPNWKALWSKRFENPLFDAESFQLTKKGDLKEIGQKPKNIRDIKGQYMGLLKTTPQGWREMKKEWKTMRNYKMEHMTNLLNKVCKKQKIKIRAIAYKKPWVEIDNPKDVGIL